MHCPTTEKVTSVPNAVMLADLKQLKQEGSLKPTKIVSDSSLTPTPINVHNVLEHIYTSKR